MNIIIDSPEVAPLSEEKRKNRKFYVALPLLIIPFITLAFWVLGGGKGVANEASLHATAGLNTSLPDATFREEKVTNKLELYRKAAKDSPAGDGISSSFIAAMNGSDSAGHVPVQGVTDPGYQNPADVQSVLLEKKLAQINRQITASPTATHTSAQEESYEEDRNIRKLRTMMRSGGSRNADPEMQQISKVLSQLQAIQNPSAATPKAALPVTDKAFQAIPAVVDGKQKVADGAAIRIRLTDSVTLRKQVLPKGQLLFGTCQVANQRLLVQIRSIRLQEKIIPVDLTVYSLDGMPGIPAPEAELVGAAGEGADNALANLQILTADQSFGAQAASSGLNAAKGLFNKKIKKIKVRLKGELPLLLRDNQQHVGM